MQILLSLPEIREEGFALLHRTVAGVPLLLRSITTAKQSGATSVLIVHSGALWERHLETVLRQSHLVAPMAIETLVLDRPFDPDNESAWRSLRARLESRFLWLPWNFVADKRFLRQMIQAGETSETGVRFVTPDSIFRALMPMIVVTLRLKGSLSEYAADPLVESIAVAETPGWGVSSPETARAAERECVRRSGKESDGIYSNFNRRLVRPLVRGLTHTPVTPNMVTLAGLPVAALAGYFFAQGHWSAYVIGALLYFTAVLLDEVDGMLARATFQESPFGCWLETFVDYTSYLPVFLGMTIGLSRQFGPQWLPVGALLLFGTLTTFFVLVHQRRLATSPDNPSAYASSYNRLLEADSHNIISRLVRTLHFLLKKGVLCHYVVIFSVLGGLPVFLALASFGSNVAWIVSLYNNRLFRPCVAGCATGKQSSVSPVVH